MGKGNTSETCGHIISTQGERTDIDPVMSEQERAELLGRMIADQERSDAAAETLERDIDKGRILEGRNVLALVSTIYREVRDLRRSIIDGSRPIDPSAVHLVASMPLDYTDNLNNRHRDDAICLYEVCKATETNRNSLRPKDEEELIEIHMKKRLQPYIDSELIPESIIIEAHTVKPSYDDRLPVLPYGSVIFRANVYPQQIDEGVKEGAVSDAVLRVIGEHAIRSDAPQHSTAGSEKLTPENDEVILQPDDLAILHWCSKIAEFARIVRQDALDNRQNEDGIYPSVAVQEREIFINQNSDDKNPTVPSRFPRRPLLRYDFVPQVTGDYIVDFIRDDLLHRLQPHIDSGLIPPVAVNVELRRHKAESYVVARVSFDTLSKEWGKKLQERDVVNPALDVPISRSS
ncbi:hypothetical protein GWK78_01130 [Candidatus Saccharibacteria bacterium oral taxon 488]|nr:hypothetical protein GWK78_01130 [Candidatus Saccharibacteria bacterium oral taxon 488]